MKRILMTVCAMASMATVSCNSSCDEKEAVVVVDMLGDFIDGTLACEGAPQAVEWVSTYLESVCPKSEDGDSICCGVPVIFIRDHHPADHSSFKDFGGIWPAHCVAGTPGGEIAPALQPFVTDGLVFDKGCDKAVEQYSGFEGRNDAGQSLSEVLELLEVENVTVVGIATEYCVLNTCIDLLNAGYKVTVLEKGLGYVNCEDHLKALDTMRQKGIIVK